MGFVDEFFTALAAYNEAVWPVTIVAFLLGVVAVGLAARRGWSSGRLVAGILGVLWGWAGVVFFIWFLGPTIVELFGVTLPGVWYLSGVLFVLQGVLFLVVGVRRSALTFRPVWDGYGVAGAVLVGYAVVLYPLVGVVTGFGFPRYPVFGAPCPVTIFTWGLFLWADPPVPVAVAVVPLVWAVLGVMPVLVLGVWADVGLLLAGLVGFPLIVRRNRIRRSAGVTAPGLSA
jgi:hypothetical protein